MPGYQTAVAGADDTMRQSVTMAALGHHWVLLLILVPATSFIFTNPREDKKRKSRATAITGGTVCACSSH